ncbi:MAG: S8 family serine peptidase [Candidatus Caldarchaeum sp.]
MCIYRLKVGRHFFCGKRPPLECAENVCPFGPLVWSKIVYESNEASCVWRVAGSRFERSTDVEQAWKDLAKGDVECVCYGRTLKRRRKRKLRGRGKADFEEAKRLVRFADIALEGEAGKGCRVGIIDSGVAENHPAEAVSIHETSVLDVENHGGIIHAMIHHLLPDAYIHLVQVLGDEIPDYLLMNALDKIVDKAPHVVNVSIQDEMPSDGDDPLSRYVNYLVEKHRLAIVVAAGNGGPMPFTIGSPGAAVNAITVGATDRDKVTRYSSRGPTLDGRFKPDLVAPSNFVFERNYVTGTSFAAPWVTAAAAVLMRTVANPFLVHRILQLTARPIPLTLGPPTPTFARDKAFLRLLKYDFLFDSRNICGAGLLDVKNARKIAVELSGDVK